MLGMQFKTFVKAFVRHGFRGDGKRTFEFRIETAETGMKQGESLN